MIEFAPGLWRSALPRACDVAEFAAAGGATVVDLTRRPRPTVERACARLGLAYEKHPVDYGGGGADAAVDAVLVTERPVLVCCAHGRTRSLLVARRARVRTLGAVVLHRVGRNLARAVRTCEAFGVPRLLLHECAGDVRGNLYGATGRVAVEDVAELPDGAGVLALEVGVGIPLAEVDWTDVDTILLGGETAGLPRSLRVRYAHIETCGRVSGLTVEAALAVALHAWRG